LYFTGYYGDAGIPSDLLLTLQSMTGRFSFELGPPVAGTLSPFNLVSVYGSITSIAPVAATPVPAALPLLATALGGLGFAGWRRRRAQQSQAVLEISQA
jgi:hypothetical protein